MKKESKNKATKLTQEEIDQNRLKDLRRQHIPSPPLSRIFEIGERVEFGAHPNAIIKEVYDDHKFYKVFVYGERSVYGRMQYYEDMHMVDWTFLLPYRTDVERKGETLIQNKDVQLNYSNTDISSLLSTYYSFGIDLCPSYQRDLVWSDDDKVELIDSIFHNRSIGNYVLVHNGYGSNTFGYEVLDGKQRISAIIDFFEDKFPYKGKLYSELSGLEQNWFERFAFGRAEIRGRNGKEGEVSIEDRIKIFIHVNSCGKVMSKEHLEKVKGMLK